MAPLDHMLHMLHMLHGRADFNGFQRMKKRSVKNFCEDFEDEALWSEKASEAEASNPSICEKIAAIAASSILNFVGSLSDLCIHPVHPGHILDIRSRLIGRSTNFCKEISIVRTC